MWQRLKNLFFSLSSYSALSPDLKLRLEINRRLSDRPALSSVQWFEQYGKPYGISPAIAEFAYIHLEQYCGLKFAYIVPGDRLHSDLQWVRVCWYDWQISLCDDFWQHFKVDLSDTLVDAQPETIGDLLTLMQQRYAIALQFSNVEPLCLDSSLSTDPSTEP